MIQPGMALLPGLVPFGATEAGAAPVGAMRTGAGDRIVVSRDAAAGPALCPGFPAMPGSLGAACDAPDRGAGRIGTQAMVAVRAAATFGAGA